MVLSSRLAHMLVFLIYVYSILYPDTAALILFLDRHTSEGALLQQLRASSLTARLALCHTVLEQAASPHKMRSKTWLGQTSLPLPFKVQCYDAIVI